MDLKRRAQNCMREWISIATHSNGITYFLNEADPQGQTPNRNTLKSYSICATNKNAFPLAETDGPLATFVVLFARAIEDEYEHEYDFRGG
jgi:hypothetical protein